MSGVLLPICSIFFSLLLLCVYFCKKRINLIENNLYSKMIIYIFIDSILVSILQIMAIDGITDIEFIFVEILNKLDFIFLILFVKNLFLYTVLITIPKVKENYKKFFRTFTILDIIGILIMLTQSVELINNNNNYSISGYATNIAYMMCAFYILSAFFIVIFNINKTDKRHIPVFCFIGIIIFLIIIFKVNPYLIVISITLTFINFIMYFTIENPDMRLIAQLNEARDQAEKANSAKSEFLSSMSHEIRTPLNAIVGFSQALKEEDIPESSKSEVDDIIMASQNLLEIVNGILDISKIEANKIEIINVDYNFKKVFDELIVLTKARLGEKPIDFRISYDASIPNTLNGDYSRIKQVALNLLTNAVKYTDEGYIEFRVSSIKKDNVCRLIISVEDSGIGIKQENISKLFSKFERFDEERNITIEGTGLGLAITKKLVDLMNGKIVVQSIYGQGSKFTVAIDQLIAEDQVEVLELEEEKLTIDLSSKKILIVDDNRVNLKVASRLLKDYQVETEEVSSGDECITKIRSGKTYDLILMDDMMPRMSGVETLKHLKELEDFNIPTVALTANAISGMREKYLSEGFDDYLAKPIDKKELEKVLQKFLSN